MRDCPRWTLHVVATALTFGVSTAAAAADGATEALPAGSPREVRPANTWLNPDALDLNVFGFSYHPDRKTVQRLGLDNDVNPGLGLNYELFDDALGITFVQAGAYYDSGRNWAKFAGLGYQFKLGARWRAGGAFALMHSRTYNDGAAFVGMIPLITYDFGRIKVNAVYFPKFGNRNEVAAFGLYFSIPLRQ